MANTTQVEPIRQTLSVACSIERAFHAFTDRIGEWWPLEIHSVGAQILGVRPESVAFDRAGRGARLVERMEGGRHAPWAEVLVWDEPNRLLLAWKPNPDRDAATEIEVSFVAEAPSRTRVEFEHRGWERLGAEAGQARESYLDWERVLARFARAADAS